MIELPKDLARVKEPSDMVSAWALVNGKVYEVRLVAAVCPGSLVICLYPKTSWQWEATIVATDDVYDTEEAAALSNIDLLQRDAAMAQARLIRAMKQFQSDQKTKKSGAKKAAKRLPEKLRPTNKDEEDEEYIEEEDEE